MAAQVNGLAGRLGTLEPGVEADVIVVAGDPLADLDALEQVRRVFIAGRDMQSGPAALALRARGAESWDARRSRPCASARAPYTSAKSALRQSTMDAPGGMFNAQEKAKPTRPPAQPVSAASGSMALKRCVSSRAVAAGVRATPASASMPHGLQD